MPRLFALACALVSSAAVLLGCSGGSSGSGDVPTRPAPATAPPNSAKAAPRLPNVVSGPRATPGDPVFEALTGATSHYGILDGAAYRIELPAKWNGELVLWAHGVQGFGAAVTAGPPPPALRKHLIANGYAWAASSFSQAGFVPGVGTNETLSLKYQFAAQFGQPARTYIGGDSMGGLIVVLALENFPEEFDGGLSFCGVVAGAEWIDYLVAWGAVAAFIAGTEFSGDAPAPAAQAVLDSAVLPALGPAENLTNLGTAFASVVRNLTGGPRPFFGEGFTQVYLSNFGLATGDPTRFLPATQAASTESLDFRADGGLGFDGDAINEALPRLAPNPVLRDPAKHPDTAPTTGNLRDPLLTLHETGDLAVPVSLEQSYRRKVAAAGAQDLLVQRLVRSSAHCRFSDMELVRAWSDLAAWVSGGARPAGDDVLTDLTDAGKTFTDPLRPGDPGQRR